MTKLLILFVGCELFLSCTHKLNPLAVDNGMPTMLAETRTIMEKLRIPLRKPLENIPDSIQFAASRDLTGFDAVFRPGTTLYMSENGHIDSSERSYEEPRMIVSYQLIHLLNKKIDTSKSAYVAAKAVIMHELTHYLQATPGGRNYIAPTVSEFNKYLTQSNELEAYAVESYYYLKYTDSKKLDRIMRKKVSPLKKMKNLINSVNSKIFDGRFPSNY